MDYTLYRVKYGKKERAVAEAKNVRELTKYQINQLDHYARRCKASYRLVFIPKKAYVDKTVRDHANDLAIEIVHTQF